MTTVLRHHIHVSDAALKDALSAHEDISPARGGIEMERFVLREDGTLPDVADHDALYTSLKRILNGAVSVETGCHAMEIKTEPHNMAKTAAQDLLTSSEVMETTAADLGLRVVPTSDLPGFTYARLLQNKIGRIDPVTGDIRRAFELCIAYERLGLDHVSSYSCGTTSLQFTHAVPDADALHRFYKVHAALMPLYYAAFENRTRINGVHTALAARRGLGHQGLVPAYLFTAQNAEDFIARFVQDVASKRKMVTAIFEDGQERTLDVPTSFNDLPESMQTLGNIMQAASFAWNVGKIRPVFNEQALASGRLVTDHLLMEARDIDSSTRAVPAIAGWFFALTRSKDALGHAESRLEEMGIPVVSNPQAAGRMVDAALKTIETTSSYIDTPFGASGKTLRDIVTDLVIPMVKAAPDSSESLALWREVAQSETPYFRQPPYRPSTAWGKGMKIPA